MFKHQVETECGSPRSSDADSPRLVDPGIQVPSVHPAPTPPTGDRFTVECRIDEEDDHVYPLPLSEDNLTGIHIHPQDEDMDTQVGRFPPPAGLHRQAPEVRPANLEPYFRSNDRGYDDGIDAYIITDEFLKENLPPLLENELEFYIQDCRKYRCGDSVRSDPKTVGNFRFRLLIFPGGTQSTNGAQVSAFVEAHPLDGLDPRWCFHGVKYQITLVNWLNYSQSVTKNDTWSFSRDGIDRGWHEMVRTAELTQDTGWLGPQNTLYFRASCYVRSADQLNLTNEYNCKKETGYTGLKNHGATCYMNGLLQSLFHLGEFRRIVYAIEGEEDQDDGDETKSPQLIQALQNVFYKLQTSDQAVNCRELMKSFGWDTSDAFTQHDAQELNRILCDRVEERMKGTPSDGSIKRLFEGEMENYIECIDVDYSSRRNETFYDVQLNIKSERGQEMQNIYESLHDFTSEETLEGDNAYEAEGHGKQRAKKGIRFLRFPPLLNLQLKRFHFDLEKMDMVKLNSRFEFPRKLDLSPFAPDAGKYDLFAVVVHNGDVNSGHYYAHIQPDPDRGWFKFDDETVTPCSEYAAIEDNYGGSDLPVWNYFDRSPTELRNGHAQPRSTPSRSHNAYMLMYIREDARSEILRQPDPKEVNPRMVDRCDRDVRLAEQRRREKVEQQTKIKIKLVHERHLTTMTGFWDHGLIPFEKVYKMGREQLLRDFVEELSVEYDVDMSHIALFVLQYRTSPRQIRFGHMQPNSLFKNHIPQYGGAPHFDLSDPSLTVLMVLSRGYSIQTLRWDREESPSMADNLSQWSDDRAVMLVIKYFCVETKRIVTLGCYYLANSELLIRIVETGWIRERLQTYMDEEKVALVDLADCTWDCYEEFSEREMQARKVKRGVKSEQLYSGDILIWQVAQSAAREVQLDDGIAPVYPIHTVADLCANQVNSVDVTVLLHDSKQPLCVDGMVATGHWGPPGRVVRINEDGDGGRELSPEEAALRLSPADFARAKEMEIKMDFRWNVQHVSRTIYSKFGLTEKPKENALWLFHAPPSCTAEEALNTPSMREQTTLKELQRQLSYLSTTSKRQLTLHVVELTFQPGGTILDKGLCPLCIRFFDDRVREVGSEVIFVPNDGNVQDVLTEAQRHLKPEWGITGSLRALECADSRLHKVYRPDHPVRGLACFCRANIFFHGVRIEADQELTPGQRLIEIFHCDRSSQQAFAQPFLLLVAPGEKSGSIKQRCKAKLQVPDSEFKSWRLVRCSKSGSSRVHLKDEDPWDADVDPRLCLEHVHPNPLNSLSRQSRHNKPLTIKA